MTNDHMTANRFLRWHRARKRIAFIRRHLSAGRTVTLATHTHATHYRPKHIEMFRATRTGAYVQRGKRWDCIDGCKVVVT